MTTLRYGRDNWMVAVLWLSICLFALFGHEFACHAQETGKIHFLTFRLTNGVFVLAKSSVVPGTLKPQPDESHRSGLQIVLEKGESETIWSRHIDDPAVRRFEYEDPNAPGVIRSKVVTVTNAEFVVRAPFYKEGRRVAIFREERQAVQSGKDAKAPTYKRILVMRAPLPAQESK